MKLGASIDYFFECSKGYKEPHSPFHLHQWFNYNTVTMSCQVMSFYTTKTVLLPIQRTGIRCVQKRKKDFLIT